MPGGGILLEMVEIPKYIFLAVLNTLVTSTLNIFSQGTTNSQVIPLHTKCPQNMIIFLLPNEVKEKILLSISVKRTHTNVSGSKFALSGRDSNARHHPSISLLYRLTHVMLYMCNTYYKHDKS